MRYFSKLFILSVLFFSASVIFADVPGTAAVSSDDFPASGYYGFTNAFSANSIVRLENTSNGKAVEIYIISGSSDSSSTFVISAAAADELGVGSNEIAAVDASLVRALNFDSAEETKNESALTESKTGSSKKIYPVYPYKTADTDTVPVEAVSDAVPDTSAVSVVSEPAAPEPLEDNAVDKDGKNYIQIGSFNTYENAEAFISDLVSSYPLIISQDVKTGSYRVLAGPVEYNELDAALEEFREVGFVDAFKKINE